VTTESLADELSAAYAARRTDVVPPSARDGGFNLDAAYAVEAALVGRRRASGHATVGRKVGFANKAVWRALKLETLVWAAMYDDTVRFAQRNEATLDPARLCAPKIEPEIVLAMKGVPAAEADAAAVLGEVEWLALGFEIIDCVYVDWKFTPPDFVAASGLHAALFVGEPLLVTPDNIPLLAEQLPKFTVALSKNGEIVGEGSGRNALRSPALCVGELAVALATRQGAERLRAGELVSSGTLTESKPILTGEIWTAAVEGIALPALTLQVGG
jgi:2-oxo-3-hexenedioate decarboxylase